MKHYLAAAGIEYYDPGEDEPGVGNTYNEIGDLKSSLFLALGDYKEWEIDFGDMDQEALKQLELAVSREQLSLIEKTQPDRYRIIKSGGYISRADYLKPYELPSCSSYLIGREDVFSPEGDLQFRYLGLEDAHAQFTSDDGGMDYSYEWRALCSDLFYFEYPNWYNFGSSDECEIMLYKFPGEPFAMQNHVNRQYDNGRMCVFVLPGTGDGEDYHYIVLFDIFKDSQQSDSIFSFKDDIMETFIMFPYWYQVQPGDTLNVIAEKYTGSEEAIWEISRNPLNRVQNPDRLNVNQRLEIPADLLHRKTRFDFDKKH